MQEVRLTVPVFLVSEDDSITAYSPQLQITGYGRDAEDAMQSFDQNVEMFVEEALEKGNLYEILAGLGWSQEKATGIFTPPLMSRHSPPPRTIERRDKLFRISA